MQHPVDFIRLAKILHSQHRLNILREYLQVMALKIIYQMKESEYLRFGGGTCLRICHNLPRYSEDLDFSLDKKNFDFIKLLEQLKRGFQDYNVNFELSVPKNIDRKRVAKYWLKFPDLLYQLNHSPHMDEKLFIKLEIDKHPPKNGNGEFFYVSKFEEYFPIFKNDLQTLFAGKIGAVCQRGYHAMRDFYDLLWYLNNNIEPNYKELKEIGIEVKNRKSLVMLLKKKTKNVDEKKLIETLRSFLENQTETLVLKNYASVFKQASEKYLRNG